MPRKVWTAAELELMTPAERDRIFADSLVTDLDDVPTEFLEQVRADVRHHIEEHESQDAG